MKLLENQREGTKVWEDFFGPFIQVVRWDIFEDFLYINSELVLGKHVSIIKNTKWGDYFDSFFKQFGKICDPEDAFKEIPEIPFSEKDLLYKGIVVSKKNWIAVVEK